jgi:sugar phosphate isomerase/epimerase
VALNREQIGIDFGRKLRAEDAIAFAARHGVRYADIQIDIAPNALESFDEHRCAGLRAACEKDGIHLGLHSMSAVNVAEISPFIREAVDLYLRAYIDIGKRLGVEWIDVHAGYYFGRDYDLRRTASLERLRRAADYAESQSVLLLLENLNREPDRAEVHYLCSPLEEVRWYFEQIDSPNLRWTFTVNHAQLEPEGIDGFIDAMTLERCDEIRLADNTGEYEIHLKPGEGIIDFGALFRRLDGMGFAGHYMCAFGSPEDMLEGREYFLNVAAATKPNPQSPSER